MADSSSRRYVAPVDAQHMTEIGALFAEDAKFPGPSGEALKGRVAITAWFMKTSGPSHARPIQFTAAGYECFVEIAASCRARRTPATG